MKPADFLSFYATKFDPVELDNTFFRTPAVSTVQGWNANTPPGFIFAAKIPQVITHEKVLVNCEDDLSHFLKSMDALGEKLGPLPDQCRPVDRRLGSNPRRWVKYGEIPSRAGANISSLTGGSQRLAHCLPFETSLLIRGTFETLKVSPCLSQRNPL
jgi:Protein of unknown function DUF72